MGQGSGSGGYVVHRAAMDAVAAQLGRVTADVATLIELRRRSSAAGGHVIRTGPENAVEDCTDQAPCVDKVQETFVGLRPGTTTPTWSYIDEESCSRQASPGDYSSCTALAVQTFRVTVR